MPFLIHCFIFLCCHETYWIHNCIGFISVSRHYYLKFQYTKKKTIKILFMLFAVVNIMFDGFSKVLGYKVSSVPSIQTWPIVTQLSINYFFLSTILVL